MSCLGVHFAITEAHVKKLTRFGSDEDRLDYLQEEIEETLLGDHSEWAVETDKAWDAMHRSLTNGRLEYEGGEYPLCHVILGGKVIYGEDDYIMSLKTTEQVKDIAKAVRQVTREQFEAGYRRIDPKAYGFDLTGVDFEYTWSNFTGLIPFWERAAAADRHILFTADQ